MTDNVIAFKRPKKKADNKSNDKQTREISSTDKINRALKKQTNNPFSEVRSQYTFSAPSKPRAGVKLKKTQESSDVEES